MRLFLLLLFWINSALAIAQAAEFSFDKNTIKLDKVQEGEIIRFEYHFTNSGNAPLVINEIKVACPCTQMEYDHNPILPGKSSVIKVSFDTKGKIGYQDRILEVYANTEENPYKLRFKIVVNNPKH